MNRDDLEMAAAKLITKAGTAKNIIFGALDATLQGQYEEAERLLEQADQALSEAHRVHARFLELEALGEAGAPTFLLVHALDILMTAMSERDLARRLVALEIRRNSKG